MSALDSLARVHSWALDEKRQKLAGLEKLAANMQRDLEEMEKGLESEGRSAAESIEGTIAYPAFVAAALERRKRLRESIGKLAQAIEKAREEVHEAYQEVKKFEFAHDDQLRREADERDQRERKELDALGVSIYERGRRSAKDHS